jgi:hypothetical protein
VGLSCGLQAIRILICGMVFENVGEGRVGEGVVVVEEDMRR